MQYLTLQQVAAELGMSRTHIRLLVEDGTIPSTRDDEGVLVARSDVEAFARQRDRDSAELAERFAASMRKGGLAGDVIETLVAESDDTGGPA